MIIEELAELSDFLQTASWPELREKKPTFFSIAGIGHKELPLSNVYSFFFDSEAAHGLGPLFLQTLLTVAEAKAPAAVAGWPPLDRPVWVAREYGVDKRQRLDLLVHDGLNSKSLQGASYAVLIENKVNHWLANNLTNYLSSVKGVERKLGVVLGPRREYPTAPWLFISHAMLAQAVQKQLADGAIQIAAYYEPVLTHFLEHLITMSAQSDNLALAFEFAQQHRAELVQARRVLAELNSQALGEAIAAAFGEDYELLRCHDDRADIARRAGGPLRYIVYYGFILELRESPGFAITLFASGVDMPKVEAWRSYLRTLRSDLTPLPWFSGATKLVFGKGYGFTGGSLESLQAQVQSVLQTDWQPLEAYWVAPGLPPMG